MYRCKKLQLSHPPKEKIIPRGYIHRVPPIAQAYRRRALHRPLQKSNIIFLVEASHTLPTRQPFGQKIREQRNRCLKNHRVATRFVETRKRANERKKIVRKSTPLYRGGEWASRVFLKNDVNNDSPRLDTFAHHTNIKNTFPPGKKEDWSTQPGASIFDTRAPKLEIRRHFEKWGRRGISHVGETKFPHLPLFDRTWGKQITTPTKMFAKTDKRLIT